MTADVRALLDRLDTALAAATPGPWEVDSDGDVVPACDPFTFIAAEPTRPDAARSWPR